MKPGSRRPTTTSSRSSRRWSGARSASTRRPGVSSERGGRAVSGELEIVLKMVAEGRITAEEAAPIVAALEERAKSTSGQASRAAEPRPRDSASDSGADRRRTGSAQDLLAGRRIRVY